MFTSSRLHFLQSYKNNIIKKQNAVNYIDHLKGLPNIDTAKLTMLSMSQIELNTGQLDGLPQNPRSIKKDKFAKLKKNIEDYPEMLAWRSLLVYPIDTGRYVIIGGNMRYQAMKELGHTEAPVFIIPVDTTVERRKAYTILDNNGFGEWNWDLLANEWPDDMLDDWGIDVPTTKKESKDLSDQIGQSYKIEIDCSDEAEQEELYNALKDQGYTCRVLTL